MMSGERILATMANELPAILRQLESSDIVLRSAGLQRLRDFAEMVQPWRGSARRVSRRAVLRAGVTTFVGMSMGRDD